MKTQKSADVASGGFLFILGIIVLIASSQIRGGMEERLPPRTLPYIVGVMILISGAALAFKAWQSRGVDSAIQWPDRSGTIRIAVSLVVIALFIAIMEPLGLPLSAGLYVSFAIWYLRRSRLLTALLTGGITGILSYYLFIRLLELSFPIGVLFSD
jgi:putative tricarboxylic transport membrane protein